ncbi:MAG: 50S ribosomal protein L31, partial [Planctomycetota bacterium]
MISIDSSNFMQNCPFDVAYFSDKLPDYLNENKVENMKSDIHPEYREVVFKDKTADFAILTRSAVKTNETIKWEDGNEYP